MANHAVTEHWDEIQRLAELGVPVPTLAERFNVNAKTIYNRCSADDWLIPKRLKAKLERANQEFGFRSLLGGRSIAENSQSLLLETWQDKAEHIRTISYEAAVKAIEASSGNIVCESASDLKHAVHVARQATGVLDTDAPAIQLSLFGSGDICGPSVMENQVIECETFQQGTESDGFWD